MSAPKKSDKGYQKGVDRIEWKFFQIEAAKACSRVDQPYPQDVTTLQMLRQYTGSLLPHNDS